MPVMPVYLSFFQVRFRWDLISAATPNDSLHRRHSETTTIRLQIIRVKESDLSTSSHYIWLMRSVSLFVGGPARGCQIVPRPSIFIIRQNSEIENSSSPSDERRGLFCFLPNLAYPWSGPKNPPQRVSCCFKHPSSRLPAASPDLISHYGRLMRRY